ncbi:MAG: ATP-binding cassette domain-containing protein, partial [Acidimicrobiia bacterium]|nr:ATP-binding cassette domain-containing protein [Acidimicrobiia bacterium]
DIPFTVWEVVMMGRHPYRRDPDNSAATDDSAVAESLERCDVLELRDRIFSSLSGGEQARVSMARVLAQSTPLILLDEPSGGLDVGHEVLLLRELRNLAKQRRGVIAVFHDLNSAAALADRVILLHRGRVAGQGTVEQVMDENTLSEVYGQPLRVLTHPFRDIPLVLPER